MMAAASDSSHRAMAWDPTGTSQLCLGPISSTGEISVFLSNDGTGCPSQETECLLRCLDAREEWLATTTTTQSQSQHHKGKIIAAAAEERINLSMDYRSALCECLMMLQKRKVLEEDGTENNEEENNNQELLSLTWAISHLAEIFLLPPASLARSSSLSSSLSPLDGSTGSLTSNVIRYLRLHHSNVSYYMDMPEVMEMLESDQPEYYKGQNLHIPGPYDLPFWNLLVQFVVVGDLSKAWSLLSHHSGCRHAEEEAAATEDDALSEMGEGFAAIRAIFLSAPIPGGRGDSYCDDTGLDDYLDEDLLEKEEEESRLGNNQVYDNDVHDAEDPGDINQMLIDDVPPNSYLLWEANPRHSDKMRTLRYRRDLRLCGRTDDIEGTMLDSLSMPASYESRVALAKFRNWQETIRVTAFPDNHQQQGGLGVLFKRFPVLSEIMSILLGSVPLAISNSELSWSEFLLMDLLYSRPDISPDDIATRAKVSMSKGGSQKLALDNIILSIMNGSAGQLVETMFSLCGGASGAALPATMTSLLCNLLVDAGCIYPQQGASVNNTNIQTELLLLAAEAIVSSFSVQEQCNVGVRTAIRLLLPNAPPTRCPKEGSIIYEPRFAAMIAELMSHRLPDSDAEARDLLQICENGIRMGSLDISYACESLAFGMATYHKSKGNVKREVFWLLRGMEMQACWLPSDRQRKLGFACRRQFDVLCEQSASALMSMLSTAAITSFTNAGLTERQEKEMSSCLQTAKEVLEGIVQYDSMASILKGDVKANLLQLSVDIALADAKGDTVQVATNIVQCLEERCLSDDDGRVISTLADPKMYAECLHIAFAILVKEDEESKGKPMETSCAFSLSGMHLLMSRLTQVLSWETDDGSDSARKEYFRTMQLCFCKGLMRIMSTDAIHEGESTNKSKCGEMSIDTEVDLMLLR